ncbi:MAG: CPBP family intramembrane metalloprotease [Anaerolineae bacterium]|nr:CPBP family intramembrane metalloprotease [Anaerolineae bacterium]
MITVEDNAPAKDKAHSIVAWAIVAALLFLRMALLGAGEMIWKGQNWLEPTFQVGTYLFTACLIWWERNRLAEFHIDKLALAMIILFKPIQTLILCLWGGGNNNALAFPKWPSLVIWLISLGLVLALWASRPSLPKLSRDSFNWVGIGILVGLLEVLLLGYPMALQIGETSMQVEVGFLTIFSWRSLMSFLYQLGYAAVSEEPLFRGFLWGYLQKAGWKGVWIWLFQAGLFMLGHIYYVNEFPISFWVIVPAGALVLGGLVWKSKTLSSSMAAHATMNTLGYTVGNIIAANMR